ncbi:tetratricopeptide repeat protein [Undibacterium sp. Di24W]|uniref:tetratricopeptide repeat protein n=1 Tax=Undibacterium sp. Di24W TaxID=3413033 RepID=UPI003BF47B87
MRNWLKRVLAGKSNITGSNQESISTSSVVSTVLADAENLNKAGDDFFEKADYVNAENYYRQALSLDPNYFDAYINLGLSLDEQKRYQESEVCFKDAIVCKPNSALARFNLGVSLKNQRQLVESSEVLRQAIEIWPIFFQCHNVLGEVLLAQNKLDEAISSFKESIRHAPEYSPAHRNLGEVFILLGKLEEAESCFVHAISLMPTYAEAYFSLASLQSSARRFVESEKNYRRAIELRKDFSLAYCNLAHVLVCVSRNHEAKLHLKKAIEIDPLLVAAYCNLGIIYNEEQNFKDSDECYQKALMIDPNSAHAHSCLGVLLMRKGKFEQAIESYRRGIELAPDDLVSYSNLLMTLSFYGKCTKKQYQDELQLFAQQALKIAKPYSNWVVATVDKSKPKMKIGFVSGDFQIHPVGFFLESVISQIDLEKFELYAYSNRPHEDRLTARIKRSFKKWTQSVYLTDEALAQKIQQDGIHILIDLAGHTAHNRLPVFAWKPAPIQISWLGYFASTGVPGMDYVISDPVAVPPEHHDQFTEAIWYVPNTRLCFTAPENAEKINVSALPALKNGFITVGCFQGMAKLTDEVLALWGKVFQQLPTAKLRLQNKYMALASAKEEMLARLALVGIDAHRVELVGAVDREQYLLDHAKVDMILDTFPYTGGTTTCEALWMGVPTLTLNGSTMISRQGTSMLTCAGLTDWVAEDEDDYLKKALGFASDLHHLSTLRGGLREQVLASPLFDAKLFARNLEIALTEMWFSKNRE